MDIYAEIKNFSFYENTGSIYVNAKVIEKRVNQLPHQAKAKFEEVQVGEIIALKTDRQNIKDEGIISLEQLINRLLNRFLVLKVTNWEKALQSYSNKSSPKFIFSTAETCGIFQEK